MEFLKSQRFRSRAIWTALLGNDLSSLFSSLPLCSSEETMTQIHLFQTTDGKPLIQNTNAPNYGNKIVNRILLSKGKEHFPFFFKKGDLVSVKKGISTWDCQGKARHMKMISLSVISCLMTLSISAAIKIFIKWLIRDERSARKNAIVKKPQISVHFTIAFIDIETSKMIQHICL